MSLIFTATDPHVVIDRTDDCPPDKPRDRKYCKITVLKQYDGGNLNVCIPRPDLDLCALAVEYYMSCLKDIYDEVWIGQKGSFAIMEDRYYPFVRTPRDNPYDRYSSNPENLFIGFGSMHAKTPDEWQPLDMNWNFVKVSNSNESIPPKPETPKPEISQISGLKFDDVKDWGFWIETRTGEIKHFRR